jgi:hypothetical protein
LFPKPDAALSNCLPYDLEIVTVSGWDSASQYHTLLAVANFTGKQKKIKFVYFMATPRMMLLLSLEYKTNVKYLHVTVC